MNDKKLTVLHLVSLKGMGGRAATALRQVRLLSARGHRILMGCLPDTSVEERCRRMGILTDAGFHFSRGFHPKQFREDLRRLAELCDYHSVDVVHAHLSQESWVACLGAKISARKPAVVRSRGVVVPILPHFFNRFLHNQLTARVIAPSRVIYEHLTHLPGFDVDRTVLLPDGVDLEKFSPKQRSEKIRAEFGVAENVPWIVMVARLQKVKGHEVFFKALRWMLDQPSACDNALSGRFRVLCACDERTPGALDATIQLAREYGVPESLLTFTGMRDDIAAIMASADVLVLPSLGSEGSSRVGLEGGASGVPIVASDVGCLPEVIIHRHTGLIVPKNDPHALGQSLLELCLHLDRARLMGQDALAHISAHYDERVMIERLEDVYRASIRR